MSNISNEVKLIGRLTKDPDISGLEENKPLRIILAVSNTKKETDFIPIKVWGKLAENLCKYQRKGNQLLVKAHIKSGSYTKDSVMKYSLDIIADSIKYLDSKKKTNSNEENSYREQSSNSSNTFDDSCDTFGGNNFGNVSGTFGENTFGNSISTFGL